MKLDFGEGICSGVAKGLDFGLQDLYYLQEGFIVWIPGNFIFSDGSFEICDGSFELVGMKMGRRSS